MSVFFISDLHLHSSRPAISERFLQFLREEAKNAQALYILGDFFEAYIGEDALSELDKSIMQALSLYASQIPTYFMHGNRDFLISQDFLKKFGLTLLKDPSCIELYGKNILLMHGDSLCTKDVGYQRYRRFVRHPFIQWLYLKLPLFFRQKIAGSLRQASDNKHQHLNAKKDQSFYEATFDAILKALHDPNIHILLHGHTHKPLIEKLAIENREVLYIVLGDWGKRSTIVEFTEAGPKLKEIVLK